MLQFWKKSAHTNKNRLNSMETAQGAPEPSTSTTREREISNRLGSFEDEGLCDISDYESLKERSKLSRTLTEILSDKGALGYFVQYMESRHVSNLISCWLEIDLIRGDLLQMRKPSPVPNLSKTHEHDSLSVSTDCDSVDMSSLCDYSAATNMNCDSSRESSPKLQSPKSEQTGVENALSIFKKYIAQEAPNPINCPDLIRNEVVEKICDCLGDCFDKVELFLTETMEKDHLDAFLGSDFYCKHQIDVMTSGNVVLDDILYNETALFYFMEFLEQEDSGNLLEFWIAASNFQQQLQQSFIDPVEAQSDAVVLYDKYFSLQAHNPLGFGDKVRITLEQNICGENGLMDNCFYLPLKLVEVYLEKNYLKPFLASQLFYKYLSELINTVQSNGYSMNIDYKNSPSDCSSERSFSTNSTFLALEINGHCGKKNRDMSIDTRELTDPDALWKRKRSHVLSCGRVTSLGKFETALEPEPDRKEFRLKNVVKKIVSFDEEDKKKEEMAWQVAEMIVKDITSITLKQQDHDGL